MNMNTEVATTFDYTSLDLDTSDFLQHKATEIRYSMRRTAEEMFKIGNLLLEVKERLPHGQFIPWVKSELAMSQPTAWRFMQIAQGKQIAKKSFTMNDLGLPDVDDKPDHAHNLLTEEQHKRFQRVLSMFLYEDRSNEALVKAWEARYDFLVLSGLPMSDSRLMMLCEALCSAMNDYMGYEFVRICCCAEGLVLPADYPYPVVAPVQS